MPTKTGKDKKGCKYYFKCGNNAARKRAIKKANKQGAAAHASGYRR